VSVRPAVERTSEGVLRRRLAHARRWLFILVAYAFLLAACVETAGESSLSYWLGGAVGAVIAALAMFCSGFPPAFYGLTARGAWPSLKSSLFSTIALLLCGTGLLFLLDGMGHSKPNEPLFSLRFEPELIAYLLVSIPLQELVFRGLFQSSARFIFGEGRRASALAAAFSTLAFSASHLPWGLPTALLMIPPGVVWAVQFERDRCLLGVTVSHLVAGYVFVGATPLWRILTAMG
jgi:hypothetical protein